MILLSYLSFKLLQTSEYSFARCFPFTWNLTVMQCHRLSVLNKNWVKNSECPYTVCHPDQNTSQESLPVILLILPVFYNIEAHRNSWIVVPKIVTSSWICGFVLRGFKKFYLMNWVFIEDKVLAVWKGLVVLCIMFGRTGTCRIVTRRAARVFYPLTTTSLGLPSECCWFLYLLLLLSFSFVVLWSGTLTGPLYGGHCCN